MRARREQRITRAGVGHILLTGLLGLGAINSQNNLLYLVFGVAAGAILVSGIISGSMLLGLRVEREPLEPAQCGEPWIIRYRVRNTSRWLPAFAILLREHDGGDDEPPPARVRAWSACMAQPVGFVAHVGPGGEALAHAQCTPHRRGVAGFVAVRAESAFPFGLFRKSVVFPAPPASVVVRPCVRPLAERVRRVARQGVHDAPATGNLPGSSDEFYGVREYTPGDSLRQIAWRRSARTGVLAVRENATAAPERLWIALDLRPTTNAEEERLVEAAIELAAAVAVSSEREGLDVGLVFPSEDGPARVRPGLGPQHVGALLDALGVIDASAVRPFTSIETDPRAATLVISSGEHAGGELPRWAAHWRASEAPSRYAIGAEGRAS